MRQVVYRKHLVAKLCNDQNNDQHDLLRLTVCTSEEYHLQILELES